MTTKSKPKPTKMNPFEITRTYMSYDNSPTIEAVIVVSRNRNGNVFALPDGTPVVFDPVRELYIKAKAELMRPSDG